MRIPAWCRPVSVPRHRRAELLDDPQEDGPPSPVTSHDDPRRRPRSCPHDTAPSSCPHGSFAKSSGSAIHALSGIEQPSGRRVTTGPGRRCRGRRVDTAPRDGSDRSGHRHRRWMHLVPGASDHALRVSRSAFHSTAPVRCRIAGERDGSCRRIRKVGEWNGSMQIDPASCIRREPWR